MAGLAKVGWHILTVGILAAVFLAIPLGSSGAFSALAGGGVDAVSSATTILAAPSAHCTIYINPGEHPDKSVLADWETFFSGKDAPLIMEDISCVALEGDATGIEMAQSLQSRLPENRMKLRIEQGVLALSKAEAGRYDTMVISDDMAAALGADAFMGGSDAVVIHR